MSPEYRTPEDIRRLLESWAIRKMTQAGQPRLEEIMNRSPTNPSPDSVRRLQAHPETKGGAVLEL